jgi:hypothetical protein
LTTEYPQPQHPKGRDDRHHAKPATPHGNRRDGVAAVEATARSARDPDRRKTMNAQTSIRISAKAFDKAGLRMTYDTADEIEQALQEKAGCHPRVSMMGSHATIEVYTEQLIDAANTLKGLGLL